MNLITDTWRGLVRRKLWPVALLLVGALVAVPLMLAQEPTVTTPPANAAVVGDGLPATYVTAATAEDSEEDGTVKRRRTLGERKDPFAPAPLSKAQKAAKKKAAAAKRTADAEDTTESGSSTSSDKPSTGGGDAGAVATPPISAAPTATLTPRVPLYSIRVRFGRTDGTLEPATVERLQVLPNDENPVLVYRGVEDGGKVAVFELTGTVVTAGDGECEPTPEDCQYLKLRAGETHITVGDTGEETDAQYQLDLVRINTKSTASKSKLAKTSSAGLKVLSDLKRRPGYAFDPKTGTLRKLNARAASRLTRAALRASL